VCEYGGLSKLGSNGNIPMIRRYYRDNTMRKLIVLSMILAMCSVAKAQQKQALSAASASCTATSCLGVTVDQTQGGATFTITANASGNTIVFEASGDGGTTRVALNVTPSNSTTAVTSTTGTGTWQANTAGYTNVYMRMSNLVGGTTTVSIIQSTASARAGGGGGGGSGSIVSCTAPAANGAILFQNGTTDTATCDPNLVWNPTGGGLGALEVTADGVNAWYAMAPIVQGSTITGNQQMAGLFAEGNTTINSPNTNADSVAGILGDALGAGSGTFNELVGSSFNAGYSGTGTVTLMNDYRAQGGTNTGGGTVTHLSGYYCNDIHGIASTLNTCFYAENQGAGANDYALYLAGGKAHIAAIGASTPVCTDSGSNLGSCNTSLPAGQFLLETNCGSLTNCFQVHADGQLVTDPVFTAGSHTVTSATAAFCGGSGPACTAAQIARGHTTDVGTIAVGLDNCLSVNEMACTYNCAQTTIATVASATSITLTGTCTRNSSATAKSNTFYWGQDDGAQIQAANLALDTAAKTAPAGLKLPCGIMLTSLNPFIDQFINRPFNIGIDGCAPGTVSTIIPLPKMDCNLGVNEGCLIYSNFSQKALGIIGLSDKFRDILFLGAGVPDKDSTATYSASTSGIYIQFLDELDDVMVEGWDWNRASGTPVYGIKCIGCTLFNSGSYAGGNYGCYLISNSLVAANMHGGLCGGSSFNSLTIGTGASNGVSTYGVYINGTNAGVFGTKTTYGVYNDGGLWNDYGSVVGTGIWQDLGTSALYGTWDNGLSNFNINLAGGTIKLSNAHMDANANITGGTLIDQCGNTSFPTGITFVAGTMLSDCVVGGDTQLALATAQTAKTVFTVGAATVLFRVHISVECTTTSASATVTPAVLYTDTSNTAQTVTGTAATCTALGAASNTSQDVTFRAKNATTIQYQTTIVNTPTYDVSVTVEQLGLR
jgi:hypothetical protein